MSELGRGARELLERARSADRLGASARERISQQLWARLGGELSPLPDIDASPVMLPKQTLWLKVLGVAATKGGWLAAWLLGAAGAMAYLWLVAQGAQSPSAARVSESVQVGTDVTRAPPLVAAVEPGVQAWPDAALPAAAELPGSRELLGKPHAAGATRAHAAAKTRNARSRRPSDSVEVEPSAVRPPPPAASGATQAGPLVPTPAAGLSRTALTLDAELELLRQAQTELNAGRAARALRLLEQHAATFPHGKLGEPREVALMLALCQLGRARDARARADQFLLAHPHSPFVGRVRQICP